MIIRKYHRDGTLPINGEVFVFGSNLAGRHGKGAALIASKKFDAIYGNGTGLQGRSYAIPTKDQFIRQLPLDQIAMHIRIFTYETTQWPFQWFVVRVGCYLAGYTDAQIAPMFKDAINCSFAEQWKPYLEK